MKNLLFLTVAFAAILVACSKDKSEDLIEPMTKSGDVTTFAQGKQELSCTGHALVIRIAPNGVPYFASEQFSGKLCGTGEATCSYTNVCGYLKK
jgi:hypothetical protein